MRVGLQIGTTITPQTFNLTTLTHLVEQADKAGFSSLVMPDHFTLRPESTAWLRGALQNSAPTTDFLESYSVLSFLAAHTSQIRLSTLVSGITMRYPAVLIRTVDTLDVLSNGRAWLGVGASPDFGQDEHQRMGLPFPPAGERVARLEEVLQMALQMWSGEDKPFEGQYYQLASTIGTPYFVHQPHPPILIAGQGNKMLRIMARYADLVSIGFGRELDTVRTKLDYLRAQCELIGRPYTDIQKTTFFTLPIPDNGHLDSSSLDTIHELASLGFDEIMIRPPSNPAILETFASELLPAVNSIPVADR
jgi:alkanesulfonate monooxygenase SsuD/methylene tetrahydromethanopterin reductase-like flavin-dependent oxidoreductase (luciferase family)